MRAKGFRLERLINNLQLVVKRIGSEDFPIDIKELYVFGSIIRKKRPGDIDVLAIYGMNEEQHKRWNDFYENLGKALSEVWKRFDQHVPFPEVVASNSEYFISAGIEPSWASSLSWSELYDFGSNPFAVSWQRVVQKKLTHGIRGVHIQFARSPKSLQDPERFLLAWSLDKPNIKSNLSAPEPILRVLAAENEVLRRELKQATEAREVFMTLYVNTRELTKELTNIFEQDVYGHTFDEILALRTILFIPKRQVKEERIREILKQYGLPADNIVKSGPRRYDIRKT